MSMSFLKQVLCLPTVILSSVHHPPSGSVLYHGIISFQSKQVCQFIFNSANLLAINDFILSFSENNFISPLCLKGIVAKCSTLSGGFLLSAFHDVFLESSIVA